MNKTALYVAAALVGIGAAVALFGLSGPSSTEYAGEPVADVGDQKPAKAGKAKKKKGKLEPGAKKTPSTKKKPVTSERALALSSDFGQYALSAAPAFTNIAMEVFDANPELSTELRAEAARLRDQRDKLDADWPTIIEEEKALLVRVESEQLSESAQGSVERIRGLMEGLNSPSTDDGAEEEPAE